MSFLTQRSTRQLAIASALCFTALGAAAQSAVSVYGLLDLSIGSTKAPGGSSVTAIDSGKLTTSYYGFGGKEDLGGGFAAVFRLEGFFQADTGTQGRFTGDAQWARTASVGLAHTNYGTVTLGRNTTPLFVSTLMFNAFGDSFGYSPSIRHYFTSGTATGDTGWSDSIVYASPSYGGFRFGVSGATKTGDAATDGENWGINASYVSGQLSASLVWQDVEKDGATPINDTRTVQFGAAYDFGVAKAFLQLGEVKNTTVPNTYRISGLGARVPVGAGAFVAQWGQIDPTTGPDRNTVSLGYLHALSKRSELYAVAMRDKIDGLSTGGGYSLGMRHRF